MSKSSSLARLAAESSVIALRSALDARIDAILDEAITIQQIASPTFAESRRAAYVYERFRGLDAIEIDGLYNVFGRLPGTERDRPAVLIAAHTDTVFDAHTPLDVLWQDGRIAAPGIGDNSLGVAALLAAVDLLQTQRFPADIWFVANSREEGMGDLGGIRAVYEKLKSRLGAAVIVEGMAFGRVYHSGIAVRRLRISCHGAGGHSWLHYGRASAIHGLLQLGAQITALRPPSIPRTTFNIGVIEGGQSVNSIAADASLLLDLRSEDRYTLADLEKSVLNLVDRAAHPELMYRVEVVGDRPAGAIPIGHPLVQLVREVLDTMGTTPIYETGSTDANVLLAAGLPTVTIGITHGGNAHRLDEFIETAKVRDGLWQLVLLTIAAAHGLAL